MLKKGLKEARECKSPPSEGTFIPLFSCDLKNGWYYQVSFIKDSRFYKTRMVTVHAFKPPRVMWAKSAEYKLEMEYTPKEEKARGKQSISREFNERERHKRMGLKY